MNKNYEFKKCAYCNQTIRKNSTIQYVSIHNELGNLFFCCKECKSLWLSNIISICAYCNRLINRKNKIKHINIHNNPKVLFFCTKECKIKWINQIIRNNESKNLVIYDI